MNHIITPEKHQYRLELLIKMAHLMRTMTIKTQRLPARDFLGDMADDGRVPRVG